MKKKYIVVSGGSGYIGSNLVRYFLDNDYNVISLDLKKNLENHKNLKKFIIDLTNYDKLKKTLDFYQVTHIFHFGAISDIEFSVSNPKKTLNINIFSTYNLLKIAKLKNIEKFIFASSIYTNSIQGSFYRISKITCEEIIEEYNRLYNLNFIIIRFGSLFGDLSYNNTINNILNLGLSGKLIKREGDGTEIRKYISIDDAIRLSSKLINKKYNNKYYNIVGNEKINFKKIINIIKSFIPNLNVEYSNVFNPHHYIKNPNNKKKKIYRTLTINKKNYFKKEIKKYINEKIK